VRKSISIWKLRDWAMVSAGASAAGCGALLGASGLDGAPVAAPSAVPGDFAGVRDLA